MLFLLELVDQSLGLVNDGLTTFELDLEIGDDLIFTSLYLTEGIFQLLLTQLIVFLESFELDGMELELFQLVFKMLLICCFFF